MGPGICPKSWKLIQRGSAEKPLACFSTGVAFKALRSRTPTHAAAFKTRGCSLKPPGSDAYGSSTQAVSKLLIIPSRAEKTHLATIRHVTRGRATQIPLLAH